MSNIGKKKDWTPCPVATCEYGFPAACIVAVVSTKWDGDYLLVESELQADGKVTKDIERDTRYFNFCPDCGRALRKGGCP